MPNRLKQASIFFCRTAYAIYLLLIFMVGLTVAVLDRPPVKTLLLCIAGLTLGMAVLRLLTVWAERLGARRTFILLISLCAIVKVAWVLCVRIEPAGDYAVFHDYSTLLATRKVTFGSRYMALFPHLFGYSFFLSLFKMLFGELSLLAPMLNAVLSVISGGIIFYICMKLFQLRIAVIALTLWTVCPSQTIYNMFTLSEPLYTTGILGFFALLASLSGNSGLEDITFIPVRKGILAGVLLAAVNQVRPVGAILSIALFLWVGFLYWECWPNSKFRRSCMTFLITVVLVFGVSSHLCTVYLSSRIDETPSSLPGYSLLVGFQAESSGMWNQADSDLLYEYSNQPDATAPWVQSQMFAEAVNRISSGEVDIPKLMREKLLIFLGHDDACVGYGAAVLQHTNAFSHICNSFYYVCLLLSAVGAVVAWRQKNRSAIFPVALYVLGLTLVQMLIEVAGRYHYSLIVSILLLAAYGADALLEQLNRWWSTRRISADWRRAE